MANMESESGVLQENFNSKTKHLFDIVDELRKIGIDKEISLPSVVVLGDQSSGKSSILEALSCMKLPKGSGMVTKCPLIIQMKKSDRKEFSISYNENLRELDHIEQFEVEIRNAQEEICGQSSSIVVDNPITLKICSPESPNLSLIDLPGLIQQAVQGQPEEMPEAIQSLAEKYIKEENTLILCVISGNQEPEQNVSTKLAKKFDPLGDRTLGVITKCDRIESDQLKNRFLKLLYGQIFNESLKHGYVMVRCRSQEEVIADINLSESLKREEEFFRNDNVLKNADTDRVTIKSLSRILTEKLFHLIQLKLPAMKFEITQKLKDLQAQLKTFPQDIPDDLDERFIFLDKRTSSFKKELENCLIMGNRKFLDPGKANLFNEWKKDFNNLYECLSNSSEDCAKEKSTGYFIQEIKNNQGRSQKPIFQDEDLMNEPLIEHMKTFENEAKNCLNQVYREVDDIVIRLVEKIFKEFPNALETIKEKCLNVLNDRHKETVDRIQFQIEEEKEILVLEKIFKEEEEPLEQKMKDLQVSNDYPAREEQPKQTDAISLSTQKVGKEKKHKKGNMNVPKFISAVINGDTQETDTISKHSNEVADDPTPQEKNEDTSIRATNIQNLFHSILRTIVKRFSDRLQLCIFYSFNRIAVKELGNAVSLFLKRNEDNLQEFTDNDSRQRRESLEKRIRFLEMAKKKLWSPS